MIQIFIPMREEEELHQSVHFYLLIVYVRSRLAEIIDSFLVHRGEEGLAYAHTRHTYCGE